MVLGEGIKDLISFDKKIIILTLPKKFFDEQLSFKGQTIILYECVVRKNEVA